MNMRKRRGSVELTALSLTDQFAESHKIIGKCANNFYKKKDCLSETEITFHYLATFA